MSDATLPLPSDPRSAGSQASSAAGDSPRPGTRGETRLRLWPGVVILIVEWLLITVPGWIVPATFTHFITMMWGPVLAVLALAVWWVLASRLRWTDRWLGLLACAAAGAAAYPFFNSGFGLFGVAIYALPVVTTAWVLWLVLTPFLRWPVRRVGLVVVFVLAWGYFTLLRFEGIDGNMSATFHYRWQPTAEQRFLAEIAAKPRSEAMADRPAAEPLTLQPGDWPGFRGPDRDGRRTGVRIATDWKASPPRLLWRHRIGPGWSSFAVVGTHLYTQEQRDDSEAVICYDRDSGTEIWAHSESARFTELVSGPGPRATPTFHNGKIYAQGAAGRLLCLDAADGRVVWSRDIVADSGAKVPTWGFSSSPLITQGVVTVFAGGPDGKMVLGYNAASGDLLWSGGEEEASYCSLHPARLEGVDQLVLTTGEGLIAFDPTRGGVLWQHSWPLDKGMARVVQPTVLNDSDLLLGSGFGRGTRRVHIQRKGDGWETQEVWTSRAINPYFNDLVVHHGHLYGFDGNFFTCVSLEGGAKKWRARGYGNGQVLLLADQDLLLVLSEKGEVALVDASPDGYKERGRFQAIEGKTWNHPVVAHGKLFVRNSEEVACYQLEEASSFLSHAR